MFDLINIFDVFLPQLLLYPNPSSPLNPEAASLMMKDIGKYNEKVKENVRKYANGKEERKENTRMDEEIMKKSDMDLESLDEEMSEISNLSQISELSLTSEIDLLEN